MDVTDSSCYYPMDRKLLCLELQRWLSCPSLTLFVFSLEECTADGQFVFTVYANVTTIPVNPVSLFVVTKNPCKPVIANKEFATFKFSVTECGTKTYVSFVGLMCKSLNLDQFGWTNLSFAFPSRILVTPLFTWLKCDQLSKH